MQRHQQHYLALSSEIFITIVSDKSLEYLDCLFGLIKVRISNFEKQFSRFLPESELTKFNNRAGNKTPASEPFIKILSIAKDLSLQTNGIYNPFILPALQKVGYVGSWPNPQTNLPETNFSNRKLANAQKILLGDNWAKIPKNAAIYLGGIGKGFILDELSGRLDKEHLYGYWLSLGGDIICSGNDLDNTDWQVDIRDAYSTSRSIGKITNKNGKKLAIATSGVTKRRGVINNKNWNHLIDPRTGKSSNTNILLATVTASCGVVADVYAKCIVIEGAEQAKVYKKTKVIQSFTIQ